MSLKMFIDLSDLNRLEGEMPDKIEKLRFNLLEAISLTFLGHAKVNVPVDKGILMGSLHLEPYPKLGDKTVEAIAATEYAEIVEHGRAHKRWPRGPWYMKRSAEETRSEIESIVNRVMEAF